MPFLQHPSQVVFLLFLTPYQKSVVADVAEDSVLTGKARGNRNCTKIPYGCRIYGEMW